MRRRLLALGIGVAAMFAVTRVVKVPLAWDLPVVLIVMSCVLTPYFLFVERACVLERGGYDLRG